MEQKFTIITASYNYENLIKETIESVLAQTYANWEMIIVDDGSKDNSIEVIEKYCQKDTRIKLYTHPKNQNKGLIKTIKLGIQKANTDWIVFLESDDTITPNYLEKKLKVIKENPEVKFIFNDVNLFGSEKRIKIYDKHFSRVKKYISENPYPKIQTPFFKKHNLVSTFSCVAIRKDLILSLDFNSPIKAFLDYYLWMQASSKASFYYIDEKLTNWRMHDSYIVKNKPKSFKQCMFKYKIVKITHPNLIYIAPLLKLYYILKGTRRSIIRISVKEKRICIFDKPYYLCKNQKKITKGTY